MALYFIKGMKNGPQDIMSGILGGKKWKTVDKKSEVKYLLLKGIF